MVKYEGTDYFITIKGYITITDHNSKRVNYIMSWKCYPYKGIYHSIMYHYTENLLYWELWDATRN